MRSEAPCACGQRMRERGNRASSAGHRNKGTATASRPLKSCVCSPETVTRAQRSGGEPFGTNTDCEKEGLQLCIMKDEPEEAELILHDALRLAHKSHNTKAIAYTYDLMANLAFIRGQLENAEKLFKATMSYLLGGGMQQEDNAIIEISLKLATIYAAQSRQELALAGYEFCISTLEEKIERERELSEDVVSADDKANTRLLLGMCLDTYARYLLFSQQPSQAQRMYEKALRISEEILGERHPQTIVLLNDLATTLDTQGRTDEACVHAQRASDLARQVAHPELHVLLSNLAAVLTHRELYAQAEETYREALRQAELKRDEASVQHIREELAELARKSRPLS
ncbi:tetratricopeptide repeat protein 19, mitochondrial isoform X2 [Cervus elaphus]|uniref:tetratricopeptide repeat protein 19, mitochondrial isoform X2 n=1 Tax=Cervus canadensis TaxID=1574408 RepID=UPI001C9E8A74|nr:tetratricopeptide repeat protein 19, mitochondrial isoform X2 [Cervus canadensis]XP_043759888.1 tetratricopeptide repeat protein 19, mitochondrial isoform X2 [Cervus elaphus]